MALKLMGKKRGMTQLFDETGKIVVCTVIEAEPNVITQIKTKASDGYDAIQLSFGKIVTKDPRTVEKRVRKPQLGHFKKAGIEPRRFLAECRVDDVQNYSVGQELGVSVFSEVGYIDATAKTIGKGYQGVIKLHKFRGGPAAHGSGFHRGIGSVANGRTTPGRCFKGDERASHMGARWQTIQNLKVVMIVEEDNLIVVNGQVPGPKNGLVYISEAVKKPGKSQ